MCGGHVIFYTKGIGGRGTISIFRNTPALSSGLHKTDKKARKTPEDVQTTSNGDQISG